MASDQQFSLALEVQYAVDSEDVPLEKEFRSWVMAALEHTHRPVEMVVRIVDETESQELNSRYRGKNRPTNVLSFPFALPGGVESSHLGDLVICAPVVKREAAEQHKTETHHWAHMVVHGTLHLRGYDHQTDEDAQAMETLETQLLAGLGIGDPYRTAEKGLKENHERRSIQ